MFRFEELKTNNMKTKLLYALIVLAFIGCKKEGCTDSKAINFNEEAKKDDGSCKFEEEEPTPEPQPNNEQKTFAIWTVSDDGKTITMNGTIEDNYAAKWDELVAAYPDVNKINIKECGGSGNDDENIKLCKKVFDKKIDIHIMDNGLVASGGTDFFLAGRNRTIGSNTEIGVHSWAAGDTQAKDLPKDDDRHEPYIELYKYYGRSEQWANDFYFFTIEAAPSDDMHNMTSEELKTWAILTE